MKNSSGIICPACGSAMRNSYTCDGSVLFETLTCKSCGKTYSQVSRSRLVEVV